MKKKSLLLMLGFTFSGFVAAQSGVTRDTYVYSVKGADTLHMDVYVDHSPKFKEEKRPVMIYIHGGAWSAGSRKNAAQEVFNRHFAELGCLSVSIDYRLGLAEGNTYGLKSMEEIVRIGNEDLIDATNFILSKEKEWNIDPKTVMLSGGSAGAINSLTIEYDICNDAAYTKRLPDGFNYAGIISQAGCIEMKTDTLIWNKKPCPMLLFHGTNDGALPVDKGGLMGSTWAGTKYIHRQLAEMDVPHWTFIEKGADHVIAMKCLTDNNTETDAFFHKFIKEKNKSIVYTEWADKEPKGMASVDEMIKYAPLYILGFGKYLEELDFNNIEKPKGIVY